MRKPVAVVVGFTKSRSLAAMSLRPLLSLKDRGIVSRIVYVVGADPALDGYAAYVADLPGVEAHRSPDFPKAGLGRGGVSLRSQMANLRTGLDLIDDDEALVIKTRPDFVVDEGFLAHKILNFDRLCAPSNLYELYDFGMPEPVFKRKVWVPWADANAPFFVEDAFFMGLKADVAKLAVGGADTHLYLLNDENYDKYNNYMHVWRYAAAFVDAYPVFRRYLDEAPLFRYDVKYRYNQAVYTSDNTFHWMLLIANAWLLATNFHIDLGRHLQMKVYSARSNEKADWSNLDTLAVASPYSNADAWRDLAKPGGFLPFVKSAYARLLDGNWLESIFTKTDLRDFTSGTVCQALEAAAYRPDAVKGFEGPYYDAMRKFKALFEEAEARTAAAPE